MQIPVLVYLVACAAAEIDAVIRIATHQAKNPAMALVGPMIGVAMIYGWAQVFILISRKGEAQIESAVYHAMASEESAKIVGEVLSGMR